MWPESEVVADDELDALLDDPLAAMAYVFPTMVCRVRSSLALRSAGERRGGELTA
jgi:hypothetical protein